MPSASRAAAVLAAALALALSSNAAAAGPSIAFEDDYAGALAEAKRLGLPIVVDVWAPW